MTTTHHFVDEAGDTTLFSRHGKVLAGTDAVSRFFIVGRLEVGDRPALEADLAALRVALLADPLLNTVPSMQPAVGKTAVFFHAKDDVPEVRHAVFRLLLQHELRFSAVVKDKRMLLQEVQQRTATGVGPRYRADGHELYDDLCARLCGQLGRFGVERDITFAVRGSKPRTEALKAVLDKIENAFEADFGMSAHGTTTVQSAYPSQSAGLQACDYLLWALQRFYERGEERYLSAMWPAVAHVVDLDAPLAKPARRGPQSAETSFNAKHPLTLQSRAGVGNRDQEI